MKYYILNASTDESNSLVDIITKIFNLNKLDYFHYKELVAEKDIVEGSNNMKSLMKNLVSENSQLIIVLSEKYLTSSVYCFEEIFHIMSRYGEQDSIRNYVHIVAENTETHLSIYNENKIAIFKNNAENFINNYIKNNESLSRPRVQEIETYALFVNNFLDKILNERDWCFSSERVPDFINNCTKNTALLGHDELIDKMDRDFKNYFNDCNTGHTHNYCTKLEYDWKKTKDLTLFNEIYQACLNIEDISKDKVILKHEKEENFILLPILINKNKILQRFYKDYYVLPAMEMKQYTLQNLDYHRIKPKDTIKLMTQHFNQGNIVFLSGNIGEGKTTFLKKLMFEDDSNNYEYCYFSLAYFQNLPSEAIIKHLKDELSGKPTVLLVDELDSFSYSDERFMFDNKKGFSSFLDDIRKTKEIVHRILDLYALKHLKIKSIVFGVRPYVLSHFYNESLNALDQKFINNTYIFNIENNKSSTEKILIKRLELFMEIIEKIPSEHDIKEGKLATIEKYKDDIIEKFYSILYSLRSDGQVNLEYIQENNLYTLSKKYKKNNIINTLHSISTQGVRSVVRLYAKLGYYPSHFRTCFTNDIILLYILGLHQRYCQILPNNCTENRKIFHYPNMFLSVSNSEENRTSPCIQPSYLTYWLKILILRFIKKENNVSVKMVLEHFTNYANTSVVKYETHLVQIALGSLGTANEYNCISFIFPNTVNNNYDNFINDTIVELSRRGEYFLDNNLFFNYHDIEFFIDDWQLPKPKIEKVLCSASNEGLKNILLETMKNHSEKYHLYTHLVNKDNNHENFRKFIETKFKLIIWYTHIFEIALYQEKKNFNIDIYDYNQTYFEKMRKNILNSVINILNLSEDKESITAEYMEFNKICLESHKDIEKYFKEIYRDKIYIICDLNGFDIYCQQEHEN